MPVQTGCTHAVRTLVAGSLYSGICLDAASRASAAAAKEEEDARSMAAVCLAHNSLWRCWKSGFMGTPSHSACSSTENEMSAKLAVTLHILIRIGPESMMSTAQQ